MKFKVGLLLLLLPLLLLLLFLLLLLLLLLLRDTVFLRASNVAGCVNDLCRYILIRFRP